MLKQETRLRGPANRLQNVVFRPTGGAFLEKNAKSFLWRHAKLRSHWDRGIGPARGGRKMG